MKCTSERVIREKNTTEEVELRKYFYVLAVDL